MTLAIEPYNMWHFMKLNYSSKNKSIKSLTPLLKLKKDYYLQFI